ncbi:MAG: hypothetical protein AAFN68_02495, partial [Pseudomonadota bacterium]
MRKLLIVALATLWLPMASAQDSEAEYEAKLRELQSTIAELKSELGKVKSSRDNLQNDLQGTEVNIGKLH